MHHECARVCTITTLTLVNKTQVFQPLAGSAAGGLMLATAVGYLSGSGACLGESLRDLLLGDGTLGGYLLWANMLSLGVLRWLLGTECSLYQVVDEAALRDPARRPVFGQVSIHADPKSRCAAGLTKPLLACAAEPPAHLLLGQLSCPVAPA